MVTTCDSIVKRYNPGPDLKGEPAGSEEGEGISGAGLYAGTPAGFCSQKLSAFQASIEPRANFQKFPQTM